MTMAAASGDDENSKITVKEEVSDSGGESGKVEISDLKVSELRAELECRDLDKSGNKAVLIERLKKALHDEGSDPEEFVLKSPSFSNKESKISVSKTNGNLELSAEDDIKDENISDVTLQLSIDDEDAQLNDDDHLELSKSSDNETREKQAEDSKKETVVKDSQAHKQSDNEVSPNKSAKLPSEDNKSKKIAKVVQQVKSTEVPSAISSKVLKVLSKNDKVKNVNVLAKSLWVTGLPTTTRAADLKALFSKQGKVSSVKIVKSAKQTPGKCYGFITMLTSKDATKAIQNLHRTEMNGRVISVERTQSDPSLLLKKTESKVVAPVKKPVVKKETTKMTKSSNNFLQLSVAVSKMSSKSETKAGTEKKQESSAKPKEAKPKVAEKSKSKEKDKDHKSREHKDREVRRTSSKRTPLPPRSRPVGYGERSRTAPIRRPLSSRPSFGSSRPSFGNSRQSFGARQNFGSNRPSFGSARPRSNMSLYDRAREDRMRRERMREREQREAERQRQLEATRHRYIERKQREEADRLEREKLKLRLEREILEREKTEILRLEREKQRMERERLEREREQLRRQAELRRVAKRPFERLAREPNNFWNESRRKVPRYEERTNFRTDTAATSRHVQSHPAPRERSFPSRPSTTAAAAYDRHAPRSVNPPPRVDFGDRDSRREVTIRNRDVRQVFQRSDFRDRDSRRSSYPAAPKERERPPARQVQPTRDTWKHERRVHERVVNPTSSSSAGGHRRVNYF